MRLPNLTQLGNILLLCGKPSGWRLLSGAACVLFVGLAACGPTPLDNNAGRGSGASTTNIAPPAQVAWPGKHDRESKEKAAEGNPVAFKQDAQSDKPEGRNGEVLGVPELVLKDLDSQDTSTRLRALDHWATKGTTVSLDPVFEAMEDQDEAVRARATAIVEQQWAIEQEKEKS